jgi:hypothetical protein
MNVPMVNGQGMRIIVNIIPTPELGQFGIQTVKEGMDDKGWDFVHQCLCNALCQVAVAWVREATPPQFFVPPLSGVQQ